MTNPCDFANNNFNYTFSLEDYSIFENCTMKNISSNSRENEKTVKTVFQFLLYFMASIGNCLLLFVMYKDPLKRFRNSTSCFIINLTLADLLSTASGIAKAVIQLNPQVSRTGDTHVNQNIAICIEAIGVECSLLMFIVFALDRYIAIAHTFRYNNFFGKRYIAVPAIIIPWCISIISLPVMYFASLANNVHELLTRVLAGNFIVLWCVTLTLHPYTHWIFLRRLNSLRNSSANHKQLLEENLKVAKVLATTVLLLSICFIFYMVPYFIAFCFNIAKCDSCYLSDSFQSFWRFYPLLSSSRLTVNTLVYAWRLPMYRKSLVALCTVGNQTTPLHRVRKIVHLDGNKASKPSLDIEAKSSKTKCPFPSHENNQAAKDLSTNLYSVNRMGLLNTACNKAESSN